MTSLDISFHGDVEPQTDVLHLKGQATFLEASDLRRRVFEVIGDRPEGRLVVELAEVEKMDTAAMAVLVEGLLATRGSDFHLSFCTPSASVRKVFELAGLEEALERCYGCLGDALAAPVCGCDD